MNEFNGKSILITGASRGLGKALAISLSNLGARISLVARHKEELNKAVSEIRSEGGVAFGIIADVGEKESIYPIVGQASALASALGPVPLRLLLDTDCEDFERVLEVNTLGPFRLIKAVAGSMSLRGSGVVINISSDAAVEAYPGWGVYGASKAALDHLTRIVALELSGTGIKFFSVDPGEMDTRMHEDAMPSADRTGLESPATVAETIALMILQAGNIENGARLVASNWKARYESRSFSTA
jgi:NAD(P)-dependent dehydrogenase (short-subunit alcohol dehydrogenase family)